MFRLLVENALTGLKNNNLRLTKVQKIDNNSDKTELMNQAPNNLAAFIWSLADLLRGDFKQSQYGRVILPFTLLRRLEGVLEGSKQKVLTEYEKVQATGLPEEAQEKMLLRATAL